MLLKSLVRKGRVHPVLGERTRLAGHVRENLRVLGLKRVAKDIPDLARALQAQAGKEDDVERQTMLLTGDLIYYTGENGGRDDRDPEERKERDE